MHTVKRGVLERLRTQAHGTEYGVQLVTARQVIPGALPCTCVKSNPLTGLDRPLGLQEVEAPRFLDNRHMKMVRLSALLTGRLYPPGKIPGTHFC
jgi:hypothetical protein